jgi:hypothetical protein
MEEITLLKDFAIVQQAGLSEDEAVTQVAQGALDAAAAIGEEAVAKVATSLRQDVLPSDLTEQQEK